MLALPHDLSLNILYRYQVVIVQKCKSVLFYRQWLSSYTSHYIHYPSYTISI